MKFLIALLIVVSSINCIAGVLNGGGGKAVVCRDLDQKIKSVETLDLYEGRVQYGLGVHIKSDSYLNMATEVLTTLGRGRGPDFTKDLVSTALRIDRIKRLLPAGTSLQNIDDSNEVVAPDHCKIEQLANYIDQSMILVNGEMWGTMDEVNKAALIVHETLYYYFRFLAGANSSAHARKAVAYGFSGLVLESVRDGIPEDVATTCETYSGKNSNGPTKYWIYPDSDPNYEVIQFDSLDGVLMLTKTYMKAAKSSFDHFGGFALYYGQTHSLIEDSMPVGFRDFQDRADKNRQIRFVGIVDAWREPTVPTLCRYKSL